MQLVHIEKTQLILVYGENQLEDFQKFPEHWPGWTRATVVEGGKEREGWKKGTTNWRNTKRHDIYCMELLRNSVVEVQG